MEVTATVYNANQFMDWFASAKPGDACQYYRGELGFDAKTPDTSHLANRALQCACEGKVDLVQQRYDFRDYSYLAVRRSRPPRDLPAMRATPKPKLRVLTGQRYQP